MYDEKSCGAVVFFRQDGRRSYLLIENREGNVGFPKGHTEAGETEEETALREIREETALRVRLIPGFRREYSYTLKNGRNKLGVYFLAEAENAAVTPQEGEIGGWWRDGYAAADARLTYDSDRQILAAAQKFLDDRDAGQSR